VFIGCILPYETCLSWLAQVFQELVDGYYISVGKRGAHGEFKHVFEFQNKSDVKTGEDSKVWLFVNWSN